MSEELIHVIFDCETGETIRRPFTEEETIAHNKAQAEFIAEMEANTLAAEAKAAAKATATVKLAALGLTPEEIAALS